MKKTANILVLEDEPIIAADLQFFLEKRGCQVLLAADADEAFSICQKKWPTLVVLNVYHKNAPNGLDFAHRLRVDDPKIKFLFITGVRRCDLENMLGFTPAFHTLHKPFTRSQLMSALANLLL